MFYSVVLLDGREIHCLSLEEVQELFFRRQINQDSLICSAEEGQWKMLRRTFDVSLWTSPGTIQTTAGAVQHRQPVNPFEQTSQSNGAGNFHSASNEAFPSAQPFSQPVTFNQFPPSTQNGSFSQDGGYSQNNQTETYYQAETTQTNYNFQNKQTELAPSRYSNPAGAYSYQPPAAPSRTTADGKRHGLRTAAVFLIVNALFYVAFMIVGPLLPAGAADGGDPVFGSGRTTGAALPIIIDLILAIKLWKLDDGESARKWVLARAYLSFIVFGLIVPLVSVSAGQAALGIFCFASTVFYFASLALVLHGKEAPPKGRIIFGSATFAVHFLIMFGAISLVLLGAMLPRMANLKLPQNNQFEKYKIEGREYEDKITGAKIALPEGWSMVKLDNPIVRTPEARMIAIDRTGQRLTMFEVVPVPADLDMKRQNSAYILDQLSDNVVRILSEQVQENGGFGGPNSFREITRMNIFVGKHPAKLLVFEKTESGEKVKGHMIITFDELTFYVLHSWCPAEEYGEAQNDFTFFEKNFSVPEKINSTFTQTAENQNK